tara:strand:+ start:8 stop:151 length:144 start_codon:yes stop_codon:yes gene_type:complete
LVLLEIKAIKVQLVLQAIEVTKGILVTKDILVTKGLLVIRVTKATKE